MHEAFLADPLTLYDVQVSDDGLDAKIITQATNTNAGCVNGMDPNGNPCVTKQKHDPICKVSQAWRLHRLHRRVLRQCPAGLLNCTGDTVSPAP